jgi:hypothetical protein
MKELQYYIFKRFGLLLFCIIMMLIPFQLCAQDERDSTEVYPDTTTSTVLDSNDENNAQKYSDKPALRSVPDTTVERMKGDKSFAYANDPAYWTKERKVYRRGFWDYVFNFFSSDLVKVIFYTLIGALIVFVLYRIIVVNELLIFYSSKKKRVLSEKPESTEIDPAAIDKKIKDAIDQRNYNGAVRYLYLKTLYTLNDKKWIQFHSEATNNEYLDQMSQHKRNKEFRFLTQVYEYVWYGKFEINEQQFALVHNNFKSFQADI